MARWLTFDRNTASALRKQLPREQVFEHGSNSAVEYAHGVETGPGNAITDRING